MTDTRSYRRVMVPSERARRYQRDPTGQLILRWCSILIGNYGQCRYKRERDSRAMRYVKPERIVLKGHQEFTERWVQAIRNGTKA